MSKTAVKLFLAAVGVFLAAVELLLIAAAESLLITAGKVCLIDCFRMLLSGVEMLACRERERGMDG